MIAVCPDTCNIHTRMSDREGKDSAREGWTADMTVLRSIVLHFYQYAVQYQVSYNYIYTWQVYSYIP